VIHNTNVITNECNHTPPGMCVVIK